MSPLLEFLCIRPRVQDTEDALSSEKSGAKGEVHVRSADTCLIFGVPSILEDSALSANVTNVKHENEDRNQNITSKLNNGISDMSEFRENEIEIASRSPSLPANCHAESKCASKDAQHPFKVCPYLKK